MKKLTLLLFLLQSLITFAQVPQKMSYQSVLRNASNQILANQSIGVKINIVEGSLTGSIVYAETHTTTTNANGLFTLEAGGGTPTTGTFSAINWGNGSHYIKSEIDITGGTNYALSGTMELLSVPYALYAVNGLPDGTANGEILYWNGYQWKSILSGIEGSSLQICNGIPHWGQCPNLPTLNTLNTTQITSTSITIQGNISSEGGSQVTQKGFCWSITPNPIINSTYVSNNGGGSGVFNFQINNLTPATTYYIKSYATNASGTSYGNQLIITTMNNNSHIVGESFGGGIIAYIFQNGDPGFIANQQHGIIVAPQDQSVGAQWGCNGTYLGTTQGAIGTGYLNTASISSNCGTSTSSYICHSLQLGGYNDWFLPSLEEMSKVYQNKDSIGGFVNDYYWTSCEQDNPGGAWVVSFVFGNWLPFSRTNLYHVRAIRFF